MSDDVLLEARGRVLVVTLNRPDAKNALNSGITQGLAAAVARLESSSDLTCAVITGAGGAFCSGMDLKEFALSGPPKGLNRLLRTGSDKPLIAAIEGIAYGGGLELALICDLLVAAEDAKVGLLEARVGLFAAGGGLLRLPRRIPYALAAELALTASPWPAEAAHRYGLVNRLAPPGGAFATAVEMAEQVAVNAPLAVKASKQLLRASQNTTEESYWAAQAPFAEVVFGSDDAKEGTRAFAEKRPARWTAS